MSSTPDITLTPAEISAITGGLVQVSAQLRDLHAQGFARARISRGRIVLERAHYNAVCDGRFAIGGKAADTPRPRVRSVQAST